MTIKKLAENPNDKNKKQKNRVFTHRNDRTKYEITRMRRWQLLPITCCNLEFFIESLGNSKTFGNFLTAKGKTYMIKNKIQTW